MTDFIEIHWTAGTIDEARKVCRSLVEERMVACAQIVPWVESIYIWDNQLETSQETKVVLKARGKQYDAIREVIEKNTTYEVPQITYFVIDGGNVSYMEWMEETVRD